MRADGAPFPSNSMFSSAGPWASSVPMFHRLDLARQGWGPDNNDRDEFTDSPPCFGDIDGDGLPEVILYSDHERAGEYINRGNSLWILNPDMTRVQGFETPPSSGMPLYTGYENNIVQVAPAPAVADIAGDMRPEIVVPSYDGKMRCFSPDGSTLWTYTFDDGAGAFIGASGAVIGDLNADDIPEVVFTTYSVGQSASHLIILDGNGVQLHKTPIAKRGSMSPPVLADIDGDHRVEIIISLKDTLGGGAGGVQIWDLASASDNLLPWPTGRGNNLRNGQGAHDEAFPTYTAWRAHYFTASDLTNEAISGPAADPDNSGLTNLARYAFALPARGPVASPVALTVTGTGADQHLALTFPRKGYAPEISYVVQSSTDLISWTNLQTVPPGYPKTFTFTDSAALGSAPRRFLRLRIDRSAP